MPWCLWMTATPLGSSVIQVVVRRTTGACRAESISLTLPSGRPSAVLQVINQSINFNLHHSIQCYIYIMIFIFIRCDTNWGCTKDNQYLSGGTTHT